MENTKTAKAAITDKTVLKSLYKRLIDSWNEMDSETYASLFIENGNIIGFDGSQANGREEIHGHLSAIFADHEPAKFITIIREIRFLSPGVGLLRAVAGMSSRGQNKINPATNAIQSLVAVKEDDQFRIAIFQNTPAAYHGRPEDAERLTIELQEELKKELK